MGNFSLMVFLADFSRLLTHRAWHKGPAFL